MLNIVENQKKTKEFQRKKLRRKGQKGLRRNRNLKRKRLQIQMTNHLINKRVKMKMKVKWKKQKKNLINSKRKKQNDKKNVYVKHVHKIYILNYSHLMIYQFDQFL